MRAANFARACSADLHVNRSRPELTPFAVAAVITAGY